ncbi:putative fatty acid desaturase protein [Phaeoacremonium minimum UCRPA7]|uniref:Delta 8-(E)-sphingolipid desaturase n=1 Tax=Phaeoacremonium minimum (strain UCR-PA7) TaxID=1286976 RepID=R8BT18_PHAM7|nr:putative fatty acid desaturase protein [Phaeoacremonium minimum UCRPA7]EOO02543.1 putative fatty acid desaturase protein [Phaeoacremonium minimum UCRPA7]
MDSSLPSVRTYPVLSRRQIEGQIADGRHIVIVNQHVLKVDAWLKYHPGGDIAIKHMVGRDATDEVTALHSLEAVQMMDKYRIGRIEGRWKNFLPPIQGGIFRPISESCDADMMDGFEKDEDATASCDANSRSPSPIFDNTVPSTRSRKSGHGVSRTTSVSSVSVSEEPEGPLDGMAVLDARTKELIKLDVEKYPSLDDATQDDIIRKYRLLNERIKAEDLYRCHYRSYAIEIARYTTLFTLMLLTLSWQWWAVSGFFLGAFWHQLVFAAHDAGHMGITHDFHVDTVIGIIIADFFGGLSLGWWKRNHNVHHIVTNSPEHDPDIEHMPFFAISHRLLQSLRSSYYERVMEYDAFAKVLIRIQAYSYYPILTFGRFNLYRLSWIYLLFGQAPKKGPAWWHRWFEIAGQCVFWTWFGYGILYKTIPNNWGRFVFVMVSHVVTMPLHLQITLSHFAMSTADLGPAESFPQKMLRTTMDVDCPQWLDFFHGGLQFQAIHHLYPRIPRHNLRRTQKLVQEFCNEVGIPYALFGFVDGNKEVIGRLADVSRQAAILAKCQQALAKSDDPLHIH